jgi:hypothetical protein
LLPLVLNDTVLIPLNGMCRISPAPELNNVIVKAQATATLFGQPSLAGVIDGIAAQTLPNASDNGGARYDVTVSAPALTIEQRQRVRLGMSANLSVLLYENPQAIVLPATAIRSKHGKLHFRVESAKE